MDASRIQGKDQGTARIPWGTIFGFAFIMLYVSFTIIAAVNFPGTVSPLDIYLSTFGNPDISPDAAIFYRLGVILAGLVEIPFFIAIYVYYSQLARTRILIIGLIAGITSGISIVMSGVYPERVAEIPDFVSFNSLASSNADKHESWSIMIFFCFIFLLLAFSLTFWRTRGTSRGLALYGFLVCAIDVAFLGTVVVDINGALAEWITVFCYLIWMLLVSLDVHKGSRTKRPV